MRPKGGPHAKLIPRNLPTEQPFLVRRRNRETWPRVRRLRTGTTYWRRSFCMGRGRCESQPDLTFVGPANAANDRQGCCPIHSEPLATGQPAYLRHLLQQATAVWKSCLLASNCSDPESRTRQVGFGPLFAGTRKASFTRTTLTLSNRAVDGEEESESLPPSTAPSASPTPLRTFPARRTWSIPRAVIHQRNTGGAHSTPGQPRQSLLKGAVLPGQAPES